jgi:hypothetical protein
MNHATVPQVLVPSSDSRDTVSGFPGATHPFATPVLRGLGDGIEAAPHPGRGPKPIPMSDAVYAMVLKV